MITIDSLRAYANDTTSTDADVERAISTGVALVDLLVGEVASIPDAVMDQAYLEGASGVLQKKKAPLGVAQFASLDGSPVRVNRDPLAGVYPILTPYLGWGIA